MIYNYLAIFTAFGVSYLIRVLPLTLIRKPIKNRFIRSFLYYVPYAVLAALTFPAVFYFIDNIWIALTGVAVAIILSLFNQKLIVVALVSVLVVFGMQYIL